MPPLHHPAAPPLQRHLRGEVVGSGHLPPDVLQREVAPLAAVRQKLLDVGFIILAKNGKDFGEQIKAEIVSKGRLIREAAKPN